MGRLHDRQGGAGGVPPVISFTGNDVAFLPTMAQEEYLGAVLKWHGVADADLPYVVPNWNTWSANGRGSIALYGV